MPAAPQFIKTVARRGYRFIAPVELASTPAHRAGRRSIAAGRSDPTPADRRLPCWTSPTSPAIPTRPGCRPASPKPSPAILRALGRFRVVDRWRVIGSGAPDRRIAARRRRRRSVRRSPSSAASSATAIASASPPASSTSRSGEALADAKVDGRLDDIFELQDQVVGAVRAGAGHRRRRDRAPRAAARDTEPRGVPRVHRRLAAARDARRPRAAARDRRLRARDRDRSALRARVHRPRHRAARRRTKRREPRTRRRRRSLDRAIAHARQAVALDDTLAEAHATLALCSSAPGTPARRDPRRAPRRRARAGNWRHLFRLGHASWGDERLRAGGNTLALYPDFAFAHFQTAMVHVARGHLSEAETRAPAGRGGPGSADRPRRALPGARACTGCSAWCGWRRTTSRKRSRSSTASASSPSRTGSTAASTRWTPSHGRGACLLRLERVERGRRVLPARARALSGPRAVAPRLRARLARDGRAGRRGSRVEPR